MCSNYCSREEEGGCRLTSLTTQNTDSHTGADTPLAQVIGFLHQRNAQHRTACMTHVSALPHTARPSKSFPSHRQLPTGAVSHIPRGAACFSKGELLMGTDIVRHNVG